MTLTVKQKQAINAAPANQRSRMAANFNRQNGIVQPVQNNVRFRRNPPLTFNRGRGRGRRNFQGINRQNFNINTTTRRGAAPAAEGTSSKIRQAVGNQISSTAYIEISTGANDRANLFEVRQLFIRPSSFVWVNNFEKLYGRFKIISFAFKYISQTPSTTAGSVWMAFEGSPQPNVPTTIAEAQTFLDFQFHNVWHSPKGWTYMPKHLSDRWFTVFDDGLSSIIEEINSTPAKLLFGTSGVSGTDVIVGYLECSVTVAFRDRQEIILLTDAADNKASDPRNNTPDTIKQRLTVPAKESFVEMTQEEIEVQIDLLTSKLATLK